VRARCARVRQTIPPRTDDELSPCGISSMQVFAGESSPGKKQREDDVRETNAQILRTKAAMREEALATKRSVVVVVSASNTGCDVDHASIVRRPRAGVRLRKRRTSWGCFRSATKRPPTTASPRRGGCVTRTGCWCVAVAGVARPPPSIPFTCCNWLLQLAERRARERREAEQARALEAEHVATMSGSALLTESRNQVYTAAGPGGRIRRDHYKGMSAEEVQAAAEEQARQRDELQVTPLPAPLPRNAMAR
jgi:hypothetical protein